MILNGIHIDVTAVAEDAAWQTDAKPIFHQIGEGILARVGCQGIQHQGQGVRGIAGYVIGKVKGVSVEFRRAFCTEGAEIEIRSSMGARVLPCNEVENIDLISKLVADMTPFDDSGNAPIPVVNQFSLF